MISTNNENYVNDVNGATFTNGTASGRGTPRDSQVVILDQQPRRFIYPKDGGRFDAPKIHVFTHLLRKCFTGKSKVRLRPPKSTIYGGSKWPLFTPKTAWIKIA